MGTRPRWAVARRSGGDCRLVEGLKLGLRPRHEIAQHTRPPLTTVLLPNAEMGRWAVEHLVSRLTQGPRKPFQVKMECPLVEHQFVAGPKRTLAVA